MTIIGGGQAKRRLHQVAVATDQWLNTLLGGWADETIPARPWRGQHLRRWRIAYHAIDALFFWQEQHCYSIYLSEAEHRQLPANYRSEHD